MPRRRFDGELRSGSHGGASGAASAGRAHGYRQEPRPDGARAPGEHARIVGTSRGGAARMFASLMPVVNLVLHFLLGWPGRAQRSRIRLVDVR